MGWKDTIQKTGGSSGSWRDTITKDEEQKHTGASDLVDDVSNIPGAIDAAGSQVGRGVPVAGPLAVKAGHGVAALLSSLTPDDWQKPEFRDKTIGEIYDALEADDAKRQAETFDKHPVAATAGSLAGSAMVPIPGAKAKGLAGAAARIAGNTALSAGDTAARGGSTDDVIDSAETSGILSTAIEAIPYVGKVAGAAKKLIPGTEGAITNKLAAKVASSLPASAEAKTIEDLYSDPALRRKAAGTDFTKEAEALVPKIKDADKALEGAVGSRFNELEGKSLAVGDNRDLKVFQDLTGTMDSYGQIIADNPAQFGNRTAKVLDGVNHILATGGEAEAHLPSYKLSIGDIGDKAGEETAAKISKMRTLNARRQLDDFVKNADFDKMLKPEKEAINNIRGELGAALKTGFSGGAERTTADELFGSFKRARDDLVKPLTFKSGSGVRAVDAGKVEKSLKTALPMGTRFDKNVAGMQEFLEGAEPQIGKLPEVEALMAQLGDLRQTSGMNRTAEAVKKGGGPTSQAVNVLTQLVTGGALAHLTGGLSLPVQVALLPITNPSAWVKVLDGLERSGQGTLATAVKKAAGAIVDTVGKTSPQVLTRMYMMGKGEDK